MINVPYIIDPADLLLVEVLEALPGRPISGERLVRPDGKISLGFYGEIEVRGLTSEQVKVKIIKQLRKYLSDEVLGLIEVKVEVPEALPAPPDPAKPGAPGEEKLPKKDGAKAKKVSAGLGGLPVPAPNSLATERRSCPAPRESAVACETAGKEGRSAGQADSRRAQETDQDPPRRGWADHHHDRDSGRGEETGGSPGRGA